MRYALGMVALVALAGLSAPALGTTNIVSNPNFDNGTTGWSFSNMQWSSFSQTGTSGSASTACGGHQCVSTLNSGSFIDQDLNTTAGQTYNLSFYVMEYGGSTGNAGGPSEFSVFWDGNQIADVLNPANNSFPNWIQFTFPGLLASGNQTDLQVHGRQDPTIMWFDTFSVVPQGAVPEPATWGMMLLGFGGIGLAIRRRRRQTRGLSPRFA